MSNSDMVNDIENLHTKFGVNKRVKDFDKETLRTFFEFRLKFLKEEMQEIEDAWNEGDFDGVVDGLTDLNVVSLGTMNAFDVNPNLAWDRVHTANMQKEPGIKPSRPNPLGLPDMIKPEGWTAPSHADNIGLFAKLK